MEYSPCVNKVEMCRVIHGMVLGFSPRETCEEYADWDGGVGEIGSIYIPSNHSWIFQYYHTVSTNPEFGALIEYTCNPATNASVTSGYHLDGKHYYMVQILLNAKMN